MKREEAYTSTRFSASVKKPAWKRRLRRYPPGTSCIHMAPHEDVQRRPSGLGKFSVW